MRKPTILAILDGYGLREEEHGNAVKFANTKILDTVAVKILCKFWPDFS